MSHSLSRFSSASLPDLYFQAWESGTVSRDTCALLKSCLLSGVEDPDNLGDTERALIDRLLYAVYHRQLAVSR